jgi:mRNA interferase RelE/StbE
MVKGKRKPAATYQVWLEAEVHEMRTRLPGNVRQRVKKLISDLADQPRPSLSRALDISELDVPSSIEIRRIRLEEWRIIYGVNDSDKWVWVLAVRRRPPYDYQDIPEIAEKLIVE